MSNIFDALQRSDSERSGPASASSAAATELLQRTEHQVVSQWDTEHPAPPESDAAEGELTTEVPELSSTPELDEGSVAEMLRVEERRAVFSQFQSFQVSLPVHSRLVCVAGKETPSAEAYRLLGVRLRHLRRERQLSKILITSTIPQEGKSLTAANLACTVASGTAQRTLLLEGDLRRPSLGTIFGLHSAPGLCEWLRGQRGLIDSIYHLESAGIWILPAGTATGNSLELLQSGKLATLMDQLSAWFDWIVIDSPPVLPMADTSVWARLSDGVLLVARQGTTEKRQLKKGLDAIEPRKLIGALLNSASTGSNDYYYYGRPADTGHADSNIAE